MGQFQQILNEITSSATGGTIGGYVLLGFYGLAAILILVGLLKGWSRGMYRALSRLITVVASVVLSIFVGLQLYPTFLSMCEGQTLLSLFESLHLNFIFAGRGLLVQLLGGLEGEALALLAVLPASVIVIPLVMIVVFMITSALLLLLHALICHIFGWDPYCNTGLTRVVGAILGTVQGVLVVLMLFIPTFGSISYFGMMSEESPEGSSIHTTYESYLSTTDESALAGTVRFLGGDALMDAIEQRMIVDEEAVDLETLMRSVGGMIGQTQLLQNANFKHLTDDEVRALRQIIAFAEQSDEACTILTALARVSAQTLSDYESKLPFDEPFLSTLHDFISYFENDLTDEYIVEDLSTLIDAYVLLMDSGVLRATDTNAALDALMRDGADGVRPVSAAIDCLEANPRTAQLADSVMEFAIAVIAQEVGASDVLYEQVSDGLRTSLSELKAQELEGEAYEAAVAVAMTELFEENGLTVSEDGIATMSSHIASEYADADELSDEAVRDILLMYFEAQVQ